MNLGYLHFRLPAPPASADGRAYFFVPDTDSGSVEDVVVFVDYENIRQSLNGKFGQRDGEFDPNRLARILIERRNRESRLKELRIYRGIPDRVLERDKHRKDQRQRKKWLREPGVLFVGRPLKYARGSRRGREKGIDTALAIDVIVHPFRHRADCVIICSRDSDLELILEFLLDGPLRPMRVEVVGIHGLSRLKLRGTERPWCHYLSREDFEAIRDDL